MLRTIFLSFLVANVLADEEYVSVKLGNQKTLDCKTEDTVSWSFAKNSTDEGTNIEPGTFSTSCEITKMYNEIS